MSANAFIFVDTCSYLWTCKLPVIHYKVYFLQEDHLGQKCFNVLHPWTTLLLIGNCQTWQANMCPASLIPIKNNISLNKKGRPGCYAKSPTAQEAFWPMPALSAALRWPGDISRKKCNHTLTHQQRVRRRGWDWALVAPRERGDGGAAHAPCGDPVPGKQI